MLVKELIQKLQAFPEDAVVLIDTDRNLCDVYENIDMQAMSLVHGKYIPSTMLYEDLRYKLNSFDAVVLELS